MRTQQKQLQALLRQLRKEAGFSQQQMADLMNKPQSFVSKYESGERKLDIFELRQICHSLDIDFVTFILRLEKVFTSDHET